MNYSTAIFLVNDTVRAVLVTYETDAPNGPPTAPREMFKTLDHSIRVDDLVIVPTTTRHMMTVCKVVEVDVEVDFDNPKKVDWIVDKIDRDDFADILAKEETAVQAIKSAEARKKREELAKNLLADMDSEAASRLRAMTGGDAPALNAPPEPAA